jgi:hypothetical protein
MTKNVAVFVVGVVLGGAVTRAVKSGTLFGTD